MFQCYFCSLPVSPPIEINIIMILLYVYKYLLTALSATSTSLISLTFRFFSFLGILLELSIFLLKRCAHGSRKQFYLPTSQYGKSNLSKTENRVAKSTINQSINSFIADDKRKTGRSQQTQM